MNLVRLENAFGVLEINPRGGRVVSWRPAGGEEVLFRPPDGDFDEVRWSHGGIPVCFPWFGTNWVPILGETGASGTGVPPVQSKEELSSKTNGQDARSTEVPLHGLVRSREWTVVERTESSVVLEVVSDEAMKTWFTDDFRLTLDVTLAQTLGLRLTVANTGDMPFSYTNGFHPYFRVGDSTEASVEGVDGCRYWYGTGFGLEPWKGPVTFGEHRDHVFWLGERRQVLTDRSLGRHIVVEHSGNKRLVVWNPGPAGSEGLPDGAWRHFVCVEPATIPAADGFTIGPGERQTLEMRISVGCLR